MPRPPTTGLLGERRVRLNLPARPGLGARMSVDVTDRITPEDPCAERP